MKARLKLVRLVFSLVVLLVFTSQFRAISAEGDGSADAEGKIKFNKKRLPPKHGNPFKYPGNFLGALRAPKNDLKGFC